MDSLRGAAGESVQAADGAPRRIRSASSKTTSLAASFSALPIPAVLLPDGVGSGSRAGTQEALLSGGLAAFAARLVGGEEVLLELAVTSASRGEECTRELSGLRTDLCSVRAIPRPMDRGAVLVEFVDDSAIAGARKRDRTTASILKGLVEALPLGLGAKDPSDGLRYSFVNHSFEELVGMRRENLIGRTDAEIFPAELAEKNRKDDLGVLAGGKPVVIDAEVQSVLGRRHARTVKVPIRDDAGRPILLIEIVQDVTDLRQARRTEVAQGSADGSDQATASEVIAHALAAVASEIEARKARPRVELADEAKAALLTLGAGGADRLARALQHLVRNAIHFSPPRCEFAVRALPVPGASGWLRLEVADEGIGIAPEEQASLRLVTSSGEGTSEPAALQASSGLGLGLTRQLAESLGARVTFESTLGEGSSFRVDVPVSPASSAPAPVSAREPEGRRATTSAAGLKSSRLRALASTGFRDREPERPGTTSARVLVVDDNVVQQRITARHLEELGHSVVVASAGHQASVLLEQQRDHFDLLVLDARLEGMSGLDVVESLRRAEGAERCSPGRGLPTIVVGSGDPDVDPAELDRLHASSLAKGADVWMTKPLRAADLAREFARIDRRG